MDLRTVYRDNHILVAEKPQGVKCYDLDHAVEEYLKKEKNTTGGVFFKPVFQSDDLSGGVMLYALSSKAYERLSEQLHAGEFTFVYYAIVVGNPESAMGFFSEYVAKNNAGLYEIVPQLNRDAQKLEFSYRLISTVSQISLVSVTSEQEMSGKLRLGLSGLKLPIFGDASYKGDTLAKNTKLALYLFDLKFTHPTLKQPMTFRVFPATDAKPWSYFNMEELVKFEGLPGS